MAAGKQNIIIKEFSQQLLASFSMSQNQTAYASNASNSAGG